MPQNEQFRVIGSPTRNHPLSSVSPGSQPHRSTLATDQPETKLLILGASARAAAMSVCRAGLAPLAADLFADTDLRAICPTIKVSAYPSGLEDAARALASCRWFYTGALENHPALVDRIAARRPLLGNAGSVLHEVRDPFQVADALRSADLPAPRAQCDQPREGRWVRKRFHSSGGSKIEAHDFDRSMRVQPIQAESSHFFQQQIEGRSMGAVFVADGSRSTFLGATRQLVGSRWLSAKPFVYAGSIGPISLGRQATCNLRRIGECLTSRFKLRGLFGVDAVQQGDEFWTVEVNPRYTASVEVLERSLVFNAISLHVDACHSGIQPLVEMTRPVCVSGKAIRYCADDLTMTARAFDFASASNEQAANEGDANTWPVFADLPESGTSLARAQPLATALAAGPTTRDVARQLRSLWSRIDQLLVQTKTAGREDVERC